MHEKMGPNVVLHFFGLVQWNVHGKTIE